MHKGQIVDKAINTIIQEIDTKEREKEYLASKIPEYYDWIDMEAKNTFHEGVGAGTLKCITGFNQYGTRDSQINKGLVCDKCPRCSLQETWEHVILCDGITSLKEKYLDNLKKDIRKMNNIEHLNEPIERILKELEQYLNNNENYEGMTMQSIIGMNYVFRRWITKN